MAVSPELIDAIPDYTDAQLLKLYRMVLVDLAEGVAYEGVVAWRKPPEMGVRFARRHNLKGLVPANLFGLTASTSVGADGRAATTLGFNVLQIVVLSIVIGVAALKAGEAGRPFIAFRPSPESEKMIGRFMPTWNRSLMPYAAVSCAAASDSMTVVRSVPTMSGFSGS